MPSSITAAPGEQPEFFEAGTSGYLRVVQHGPPTTEPDDVPRVVAYLKANGWQSASAIAAALDLGWGEAGKRRVRAIAADSLGQIISGQSGYKATCTATPDERAHACAWLRSQAREMERRAAEIEAIR